MEKKQRSLALAGAGITAAAALGLTGATLAGAAETTTTMATVGSGQGGEAAKAPGRGGGMRDAGGTLSADAASKAVAAAQGEVDGGTVNGVRALSSGSFVVHVTKSDGTHVHVVLDATFAVTSVEEGGMGRGGRDKPAPGGDDSTGSTEPSATSTSAPTT
jgi:hypothetical protein